MPFLRMSRDEHGYENIYVLHSFVVGDRTEPRLIYWFRTPPNVKVGRTPLDDDTTRAIENFYPELDFDWDQMLRKGGVQGKSKNSRQKTSEQTSTNRPRGAEGLPVPVKKNARSDKFSNVRSSGATDFDNGRSKSLPS